MSLQKKLSDMQPTNELLVMKGVIPVASYLVNFMQPNHRKINASP